jgi:hypothetical protein
MFPVDQSKTTASSPQDGDPCAIARHRELILEIRALRSAIEERESGARRLTSPSAQLGGIHRLKHELDLIHAAIAATKHDADALQSCMPQGVAGRRVAKVVATLKFIADHIVNMTEIAGASEAGRGFTSATITKRPREWFASAPRAGADGGAASPYDIEALLV